MTNLQRLDLWNQQSALASIARNLRGENPDKIETKKPRQMRGNSSQKIFVRNHSGRALAIRESILRIPLTIRLSTR
jgi:hypothetical protein